MTFGCIGKNGYGKHTVNCFRKVRHVFEVGFGVPVRIDGNDICLLYNTVKIIYHLGDCLRSVSGGLYREYMNPVILAQIPHLVEKPFVVNLKTKPVYILTRKCLSCEYAFRVLVFCRNEWHGIFPKRKRYDFLCFFSRFDCRCFINCQRDLHRLFSNTSGKFRVKH